jgi:hypothetical protein
MAAIIPALPERVEYWSPGCAVDRAFPEPGHERRVVFPIRFSLREVIGYSSFSLIDLREDEEGVSRWCRFWIERI